MNNEREKMINIMSYVDFAKLCHVIECFSELDIFLGKKTLLVLPNQFKEPFNGEKYLNEFESGLSKIDTRTYHDFTIDEKEYNI